MPYWACGQLTAVSVIHNAVSGHMGFPKDVPVVDLYRSEYVPFSIKHIWKERTIKAIGFGGSRCQTRTVGIWLRNDCGIDELIGIGNSANASTFGNTQIVRDSIASISDCKSKFDFGILLRWYSICLEIFYDKLRGSDVQLLLHNLLLLVHDVQLAQREHCIGSSSDGHYDCRECRPKASALGNVTPDQRETRRHPLIGCFYIVIGGGCFFIGACLIGMSGNMVGDKGHLGIPCVIFGFLFIAVFIWLIRHGIVVHPARTGQGS